MSSTQTRPTTKTSRPPAPTDEPCLICGFQHRRWEPHQWPKRFDRAAYMREYMRQRRQRGA